MNRWVSPPLPLYLNQSTLIKGGEWRNILSVRRFLINQDCGVIYSLGRDELGQVWKIYSSDEGRQGTLTLRPSAALTYLILISSNYFFKCNWKLIEENRWCSAVFSVIQMSIYNRSSTTLSSVKSLADYPALSVDRAGGGNPLHAEDTPNQEFLIWCAPIQEFLNWCVTNQDQSL